MSGHLRLVPFFLLLFFLFAPRASPAPLSGHSQLSSPRAILGFTPGDDRTIADWKQITDYFARLDRESERIKVETLGRTTLNRPLIAAFISSPENIRDLAKYKEMARKLADPRLVSSATERAELLREGRAVVVISCSIHSTEIVASQMSMQLAYELASAEDEETRRILQQTILILIPSANPDGVDVIAQWYRRTLGTSYEGSEPPEIYHHYAGHDNNRDWFMLNLRETRLLTHLLWREWFPQIVYDVHQQGTSGSRFFVPPFYDPSNPRIDPLLLREVGLIGHKIAADLQAAGYQGVITNALYDTWWHGGFRSAPYFHNSIGILSEAASARLMSPVTITRKQLEETNVRGMPNALQAATNFPDPWPGGVWHPPDILQMELSAARSVLSLAANYRTQYLANFYALGQKAIETSSSTQPVAYLIPAAQDEFKREAMAKMLSALIQQGVEVHRIERALQLTPLGDEVNNKSSATVTAGAGNYLIFLAQPYRADVLALFERQHYPDRRTPDGHAERPYDVTGWTLPLQMGVEIMAVAKIREPASAQHLSLVRDETELRRSLKLPEQRSSFAKAPARVGIYRGWTNSIDEGWTRFVFDSFNLRYESVRDADMRKGDLRAGFDVLVLPSQSEREIVEGRAANSYPAEYTGGISEAGVLNLRSFVEAGGTLICFDAATELAIKRFNLPLRNELEGIGAADFYCPGSILRLDVDTNQALARGLGPVVNAYFINSRAFTITDPSRVRVVARYAERALLQSGWLLGEKYLNGRAALVEVSQGRGRLVLFGFRPQHRGQTWATYPFIFNAIRAGSGQQSVLNNNGHPFETARIKELSPVSR